MRMWEIREKDRTSRSGYRMGMRDKSVDEAYECGFEDGYEAAMKEMEEYDERSSYRNMRHKDEYDEEPSYKVRRR